MTDEELSTILIRHEIAARKLDAGEADKIVRLLNAAIEDATKDLAARHAVAATKGKDRGLARTKLLSDIVQSYTAINDQVYKRIGDRLESGLIDRARHESDFARAAAARAKIDTGTRPPDTNYLRTLVNTTPIPVDQHGAALLKPWVQGMAEGDRRRFEGALRTGLALGETTDQLVKRIEAGGWAKSRQSAQTVAITANSAIANAARLDAYRGMRGITHVEWSSILDTRTSTICQQRSGTIYAINDPHPVPPAHPRCRSLLLPRRDGTSAALHKPYREWLRGQSAEVQDEVLGRARADLYRGGTITDADLYRQDGSYRTLDELRALDAKLTQPEAAPAKPKPTKAQLDAQAKDYCLKQGRSTGNEHLVCYDEFTGEVIARQEGDRSSVTFDGPLLAKLRDERNSIVLHHNHPRSSSLSLPDMLVVTRQPGAKGIWAHGHNGSSFYAERGRRKFSEAKVKAVTGAVRKALQLLINRGIIPLEDATLLDNHLIWSHLHQLGQITYVAQLAGDSLKAFERNKAIYNLILENLK